MKRYIILIPFIICLAFGPANAKTLGDFNNDGKLTIADAIGFIRVLMEKDPAGDVGQEYMLASECQGVQSDLVGDWEKPGTEDSVTYYTEVYTFHSNGTGWVFCLIDETQVHEHGWSMFTYSLAGNTITMNWVVEPRGYKLGSSFAGTYAIIDDTVTFYDQEGNVVEILTRRI